MSTFLSRLSLDMKQMTARAHADRKWLSFYLQVRQSGFFYYQTTVHVRSIHRKDVTRPVSLQFLLKGQWHFLSLSSTALLGQANAATQVGDGHAQKYKPRALSFICAQQRIRHSNKPRRQHLTQQVRHYHPSLLSTERRAETN